MKLLLAHLLFLLDAYPSHSRLRCVAAVFIYLAYLYSKFYVAHHVCKYQCIVSLAPVAATVYSGYVATGHDARSRLEAFIPSVKTARDRHKLSASSQLKTMAHRPFGNVKLPFQLLHIPQELWRCTLPG